MFDEASQETAHVPTFGGGGGGGGGARPAPAPRSAPTRGGSRGATGPAASHDYAAHYVDGPTAQERATSHASEIIDAELKLIAKQLQTHLPALKAAAKSVENEDAVIAIHRESYQEAVENVKKYHKMIVDSEPGEPKYEFAKRKKAEWKQKKEDLGLEVQKAANPKYNHIAKVRDAVLRKALMAADKELKRVFEHAQSLALTAEGGANINAGADYVSHAMNQITEQAAALEMAGNQTDPLTGGPAFLGGDGKPLPQQALGELTSAQKTLTDLRTAFKIENYISKPTELDQEATVEEIQEAQVSHNLDAALAQAQVLGQELDRWRHIPDGQGPADGQYDAIKSAADILEQLVSDATQSIAKLDDAAKLKLRARVASVRKELDRVQKQGGLVKGASAPASVSGTIEGIHSNSTALKDAAKPSKPQATKR